MLGERAHCLTQAVRAVGEQGDRKLAFLESDSSSGKNRLLTIDTRPYTTKASSIFQDLFDDRERDCSLFFDKVELFFSPEVGRPNPADMLKKVPRERLIVLSLPPSGSESSDAKAYAVNTVFDRALALEDDLLDFFYISHPTVRQILARSHASSAGDADGALAYLHVATDGPPCEISSRTKECGRCTP